MELFAVSLDVQHWVMRPKKGTYVSVMCSGAWRVRSGGFGMITHTSIWRFTCSFNCSYKHHVIPWVWFASTFVPGFESTKKIIVYVVVYNSPIFQKSVINVEKTIDWWLDWLIDRLIHLRGLHYLDRKPGSAQGNCWPSGRWKSSPHTAGRQASMRWA